MRHLLFSTLCGLGLCHAPLSASEDWPRWRGPAGDGRWNPGGLPADWERREPTQIWKRAIGPGFGGVTVAGSRVYVMDRQKQPREVERVVCVSAGDGTELWQATWAVSYGKMDYGTGPRTSVTIHDGRVYALGATGVALCADAASASTSLLLIATRDNRSRISRASLRICHRTLLSR